MRRFAGGFLGVALLSYLLYRLRRHIWSRWLELRPHEYETVQRQQVPIPLRDGVVLWATHYQPGATGRFPTILVRAPWINGPVGRLYGFAAERFAERGYHVVVQNVRATRDPEQLPHSQEETDGQDTIAWIRQQPWFAGNLGMWGASYAGYVQWRAAAGSADSPKALFIVTSASRWSSLFHADGALALDTTLRLRYGVRMAEESSWRERVSMLREQPARMVAAVRHLPVEEADLDLFDEPDAAYRRLLRERDPDSDFWRRIDCEQDVPEVSSSVHLLAGWYDIFLREQLADYRMLVEAGRSPFLTVGPWSHLDAALGQMAISDGLRWFDAQFKRQPAAGRRARVRVYIMGEGEWRHFASWPPATTAQAFFPQAEGRLEREPPQAEQPPDQYLYNPERPTPAVGGPLLHEAGQRDNRALDQRDDVLLYTTAPLLEPLTLTGTARVTLYVKSSLAHTDFFVRLSDVDPAGRSLNVADGFIRVTPDDQMKDAAGVWRLDITLWPSAYTFLPGHALRLLVASGAHPRWDRNPGTERPVTSAGQVRVAVQSLYHDAVYPSELVVPVLAETASD